MKINLLFTFLLTVIAAAAMENPAQFPVQNRQLISLAESFLKVSPLTTLNDTELWYPHYQNTAESFRHNRLQAVTALTQLQSRADAPGFNKTFVALLATLYRQLNHKEPYMPQIAESDLLIIQAHYLHKVCNPEEINTKEPNYSLIEKKDGGADLWVETTKMLEVKKQRQINRQEFIFLLSHPESTRDTLNEASQKEMDTISTESALKSAFTVMDTVPPEFFGI